MRKFSLLIFIFALIPDLSLSKKKDKYVLVENFSVDSGNYLSWYFAEKTSDTIYSLKFLKEFKHLINNNELIKKAFFSSLLYNDYDLSLEFAKKFISFEPSNFFTNLVLSTDAYMNGDYDNAENFLSNIKTYEIDEKFIQVIHSWIKATQGNTKKAIEFFDEENDNACIPLNCLHKALIFDIIDRDKLAAKKNYEYLSENDLKSYRVLEILLDFYIRNNNKDSAQQIFNLLNKSDFNIGDVDFLDINLEIFSPLRKPSDGLAEAYFNISGWFYENGLYKFSAYFANIGLKLRPDHQPLNYLLLNIYRKLNLDNLVIKSSKKIKDNDIYYLKSSKVVIKSLNILKKNERITHYVKKLIIKFPKNNDLKLILADNLRQTGYHKESIKLYSDIINKIKVFNADHWSIFYARGISYERLKDWKHSDKDLLRALELKPNSAYVMNYLGYSWLERNVKLNQALELIKSANKLEPGDAFITDSLGWAYYLLGYYKESITILEKAISILPFDPTLNDHLGDAYWKVGRKKEAYSQWKKVLVYDPEFEKRKTVKHKITSGL